MIDAAPASPRLVRTLGGRRVTGPAALSLGAISLLLAATATARDVEITGLDGRSVRGELKSLAPEIELVVADQEVSLAWADVLSLRPITSDDPAIASTRPQSAPPPLRFALADGSAFGGWITDGTPDGVRVRLADDQSTALTLDALRTITASTASSDAVRSLTAPPSEGETSADTVVVARGKDTIVLRGAVRGINAEHVLFHWNGADRELKWARIVGVALARTPERGATVSATLRNGDVFAGRVTGSDDATLTLQSSIFEALTLPWAEIARLDCRSERLVFLSDLRPVRYNFDPFFDKRWPLATDRSLTGKPIQLGKRVFARGVAMHSASSATWRLRGAFQQFAATVGVVDETRGRGVVTLRIRGDDRVLWEAAGVRGGEAPQDVTVSVRGVDELTLEVDYDEELDLSDHAAWGLARLIR
ncbi:MAG: NPCBM/NEW2 domain-containing protein [Phycisphaerae bacterium]